MKKKLTLDPFEQDIEDNFESLKPIANMQAEMARIKKAALQHVKRKKPTTSSTRNKSKITHSS